jgi:hypothetical protein
MSTRQVQVSISGSDIRVNPDPIPVDPNVDNVEWTNNNGTAFTIDLPPGEPKASGGASGGKYVCTAGPFQNSTKNKKRVKYTVKSGGAELDPEVEVQPGP